MSRRGATLLQALAKGLCATASPAACPAATPTSVGALLQGAAAPAPAALATAAGASRVVTLASRRVANVIVPHTIPETAQAATAACPSTPSRALPWVGGSLVRLWRSAAGGGSAAAAAAAAAADTGRNAGWRLGGRQCPGGVWSRRVVYGNGRGRTATVPAVPVPHCRGTSGVSQQQQFSGLPSRLVTSGARRLAAAPAGLVVAAAAMTGGIAVGAVGGSATVWGPLAGGAASAVRSVWRDSRGYEHFQGRGSAWSPHNPRVLYATAAMGVAALMYYIYCLETVPYTGRRHSIMLVSPYREQWMGKMGFEQFKALARAEHKLLPDTHPDVLRVRRLGSAIAAVASDGAGGGSYDHMQGLHWEFAVINDNMVNAAVLPGGKVIVFRGLLKLLGANDDELAAVMAHEVGHVLARHPAENMSTLNVWLLINTALRLTLGFALPDVAMYLALILPNSRKNEHEADVIGLRLMARACFDPAAATTMLDKLHRAEKESQQGRVMGGSLPPFLSTHPLTTDRVKLLEKDLPQAYKLFEEAGCASSRGDFRRSLEAWLGGGWGAVEEQRFRAF